MWYTTFVGNPAVYNSNSEARVRFDGEGSNTHFTDFAILGKLNYRNDSEANDGFSEVFGTNSSIARVWVEHTKTGAWLANALGMLITDCRFRNTIADGINIDVGMQGCIVSNCTARGTGDDSFAIWPATYRTAAYQPGYNVFTHCTAQSPWFANACGIYGGVSNRVENCRFVDTPDGCGILIAGTFPIGSNVFAGITVAQNCDLVRCGGFDPGWQWRGALTLCPQNIDINGVQINNLNISNSLSYAVQIVDPGGGVVTNATMSSVNASGYALQVHEFHPQNNCCSNVFVDGVFGVLARSDAKGSINVTDLVVSNTPIISQQTPGTIFTNQSNGQFTFNFLTQPISVTVQANPAGHSFVVDSVTYTNTQTFNWTQGSIHTIATTTPQNGGTGVQERLDFVERRRGNIAYSGAHDRDNLHRELHDAVLPDDGRGHGRQREPGQRLAKQQRRGEHQRHTVARLPVGWLERNRQWLIFGDQQFGLRHDERADCSDCLLQQPASAVDELCATARQCASGRDYRSGGPGASHRHQWLAGGGRGDHPFAGQRHRDVGRHADPCNRR